MNFMKYLDEKLNFTQYGVIMALSSNFTTQIPFGIYIQYIYIYFIDILFKKIYLEKCYATQNSSYFAL